MKPAYLRSTTGQSAQPPELWESVADGWRASRAWRRGREAHRVATIGCFCGAESELARGVRIPRKVFESPGPLGMAYAPHRYAVCNLPPTKKPKPVSVQLLTDVATPSRLEPSQSLNGRGRV